MERLILSIIGGILSIFLSDKFLSGVSVHLVPGKSIFFGVPLTQDWQAIVIIGITLGLISFFIKPILQFLTLPLRVLTLGLFSLILNMALVWVLDILFPELQIVGLVYLFYTTAIVWLVNTMLIGIKT